MAEKEVSLNRGLQGVYLDRTNTTFIDGKEGVLEYSGFNIYMTLLKILILKKLLIY